jgi:hypothetical protein
MASTFIEFCRRIGLTHEDLQNHLKDDKLLELEALYSDHKQQNIIIDSVIYIMNHAKKLKIFNPGEMPTHNVWTPFLAYKIGMYHIQKKVVDN